MGKKIEGYWWSERKPHYPMPEPNVLTPEEAKEIYNLMVEKQNKAETIHYFGMSTSRITGEMLGCEEYYTDEWVWTQDLGPHYVLKHLVRPSDEFLLYIGYIMTGEDYQTKRNALETKFEEDLDDLKKIKNAKPVHLL